ncbi:MAG: hypothetical protein NC311_07705 [Muribaculaceae bacterium]|nr:hypothetical protein [Muribaculaceae bacterium]
MQTLFPGGVSRPPEKVEEVFISSDRKPFKVCRYDKEVAEGGEGGEDKTADERVKEFFISFHD